MSNSSKSEAHTLFEMVKERYGNRLSVQELEEVRKGVEGVVEMAEALRAVRLDNSVEPFQAFAPYRKED
jgi:hypothetical protein